jgi:serine/threonine protein kinase
VECPADSVIADFVERRLGGPAARTIELHLLECILCRDLVASVAEDLPLALAATAEVPVLEPTAEPADDVADLASRIAVAQARRRIGTTLRGKWTIDGLLGIGGMAQVFAGTHRNGRRIAIKMLRQELVVEPELVRRFVREGYVANRVDHPGTVAILDDDLAEDGTPFLVMELLEGESLATRLGREGALAHDQALTLADALLTVIEVAHERGIVHRDIKPDNIFLCSDGSLKVLDFGIAQLRERLRGDDAQTKEGTTLGTLGFMPPEQARGRVDTIDARSDVWALGATVFSMLCGRPVQTGETFEERLLAAMTTPVPSTRSLCAAIPPLVADVLDRALAFEPEKRFDDARALRAALRAARAGSPLPRVAEPIRPERSRRWPAIALTTALLGIAAAGAVVGLGSRTKRSVTPSAAATIEASAGVAGPSSVSSVPDRPETSSSPSAEENKRPRDKPLRHGKAAPSRSGSDDFDPLRSRY